MENIAMFLKNGELEILILAVLTICITAIIKIPIKRYAQKKPLPKKFTRYISLIPFVVGGTLSLLWLFWKNGYVDFEDEFFNVWYGTSGLSIALYSCFSDFRDSNKITFQDKIKEAIYTLLRSKLSDANKARLKELTEVISEKYYSAITDSSDMDFNEDLQAVLQSYLSTDEIGTIAKQIDEIWAQTYGAVSEVDEEVLACTATEKYEYKVKKYAVKRHKQQTEGDQEENGKEHETKKK